MLRENGSITAAVQQIPHGLFVLTTAHGGTRSGILAKWVQPCSLTPPLVMVAIAQGLPVEPLIRDSRSFALCQISDGDHLLRRLFTSPPGRGEDPFFAISARTARTGSPIIDRALSYLDCQVVRHVDLDTDHRLFVGEVVSGAIIDAEKKPVIELGGQVLDNAFG